MKELLYLKDEELKVVIEKLFQFYLLNLDMYEPVIGEVV